MTTVANRKFAEMKQLEFQQTGSASTTAMLLQPLLDKSSTWLCEVVNFECDMSEELAFPENEHLFTILRRPTLPPLIQPNDPHHNVADYEVHLNINSLQEYIAALYAGKMDRPVDDYDIWGYLNRAQDALEPNGDMELRWNPDTGPILGLNPGMTVAAYTWATVQEYDYDSDTLDHVDVFGAYWNRETHILSRRYYSTLDFVSDVAMQVSVFDRTLRAERLSAEVVQGGGADPNLQWEEAAHQIELVSFSVDSGGNMFFTMKPEFTRDYMIILSPLFQHITGLSPIVGFFQGAQRIETASQLVNNNDLLAEGYMIVAPGTQTNTVSVSSKNSTIFEGIDARKKILLEVSLPLPHTLAWDGNAETTRFVLQEFQVPSGSVESKYIIYTDFNRNLVQLRQDQRQGPMVLLNGGSNMALKKMFEGQLQAFRIDIILEKDEWDAEKLEFNRVQNNMQMANGGFFYLKLLFTKETL